MTAPYENAEFIELGTIMPPEKFRTVLPEDRDAPGGLTEQKVVIEFRRDSPIYSQLLPCFRGAMFVYGFLRPQGPRCRSCRPPHRSRGYKGKAQGIPSRMGG